MSDKKTDKNSKEPAKSKYAITKLETAKHGIPLRPAMKSGIIPRFPFSMLISGRSGSGKTNTLLNLLTRPEFFGNYFHYSVIFSPTACAGDDMYNVLQLPKENIKNEFSEDDLKQLIESRKKMIEDKGIEWVSKNSRVLVILDDVIADQHFLNSPEALKMFALLRHYLCSVIVLTQSYKKIPRSLRLNVNATIVFPGNQSEVEVLLDEITPAGLKKRDFERLIADATEGQYDFLYINNHAEPGKRIRKNIDEIIDLNKYKN